MYADFGITAHVWGHVALYTRNASNEHCKAPVHNPAAVG